MKLFDFFSNPLGPKWAWLFRRHRGAGSLPIVELLVDWLSSPLVGKLLFIGSLGSFLILFIGQGLGWDWAKCLSICGLTLDVFGVLIVFKEWLLQHEEYVHREFEEANQLYLKLAGEPPEEIKPLGPDEPYHGHVGNHLMDGVRDRINDHVALMLPGIALLVIGFVFQIISVLLK